MLFRIDPDDPATVATMEACARAVSDLAAHGLMAMVEPFISHRVDGRVRNDLSPEAVIRSITVAAGLGATSAYTWLKLPVVDGHGAGHGRLDAAGPAARRRGQRRPGRRLRELAQGAADSRPCTASSSAGRCSSRPTTTSPARSTRLSGHGAGVKQTIGRQALPAGREPATDGAFSLVVTPEQRRLGLQRPAGAELPPGGSAHLGHRRGRDARPAAVRLGRRDLRRHQPSS